ncbi:unnamed protein product [Microthlaspi erraticum]|uniref:Uncharacterized protein n=1 Tax=Microthlaspi erraticum TaxID=1685480 RepID=A0A6D2KJA2_9BRAS|nr:unnamed protein product [Microthlaspi erraticum]
MLDLGLHVSAHDWRRPKKPGSLLNSYKYAPPAPSPNHSIPKAREHLKSLHCCEVVMGNLLGREVMPSISCVVRLCRVTFGEGPYVEYDSDVERSRTAEPPDLSRFVWVLFRGKGSSAAEPVV